MDGVEAFKWICQRIGLMKFEWIARLRPNVHANDVKARPAVAHSGAGAAAAAEKIKEPRLHSIAAPTATPRTNWGTVLLRIFSRAVISI